MRVFKYYIVMLAAVSLVPFAMAEDKPNETTQLILAIDLTDGSRLFGTTSINSISIQTTQAKMDIVLSQVQSIEIADDRETASLELKDGDKLNGALTIEPIALKTVIGQVAVAVRHIASIKVSRPLRNLPVKMNRRLALYYSFDEDEGEKVTDLSGEMRHGKLVDAILTKGKNGRGYTFDGKTSHIVLPDPAMLSSKKELTVSFWLRQETIKVTTLLMQGVWGAGGMTVHMGTTPTGEIGMGVNSITKGDRSMCTLVTTSVKNGEVWHHIVATFNGGTFVAYVDGSRDQAKTEYRLSPFDKETVESPPLTTTPASVESIRIGSGYRREHGHDGPSSAFHGDMDELMIWHRALTETEVKQLYDSQK